MTAKTVCMRHTNESSQSVPRISSLVVRNYRALQNLELKDITPLTVFLGPNGSGKSTVFDVFAFLSECFTDGLRRAWDRRNRFNEMLTRGAQGNIVFELKYREKEGLPLVTYHLEIGETRDGPFVAEEWLQWKRSSRGRPFRFLEFREGKGSAISGEMPDVEDTRGDEQLESPDVLAVTTLGQFAKHPRVSALRRFITGWHLSYLTADHTRGTPEAGPQEQLSQKGDNLPNVIQYFREQYPERLDHILRILSERVPQLEKIQTKLLADGRLLLQIKDSPFEKPILAKFTSDGTLKMLSYLLVLQGPNPSPLIGIEEPENHLHPSLLLELAEECRVASARSQLLVTTHSPFFVNGLRPEEVRVLYRDDRGYTQTVRAGDMDGIREFMQTGAQLGHLWSEGHFQVGYPLLNAGRSKRPGND